MLIESEGILYRGSNLEQPEEVWHYVQRVWVPYKQESLDLRHTREIDDARAETLKVDNPAAGHYQYYDKPPWAQW